MSLLGILLPYVLLLGSEGPTSGQRPVFDVQQVYSIGSLANVT